MNKKIITIAIVAVVAFAAAYFGSPYWAARQFREAALSADVDRLEGAVDFPSVRESLKSQMMVGMTAKMSNDPGMRNNPFSGLATMMIPTMVNSVVDGFVTPQGLSALMKQGAAARGNAPVTANPNLSYDFDYRTIDRFAVTVVNKELDKTDPPKFVFERRGLFTWKVIRLELPEDFMAGRP